MSYDFCKLYMGFRNIARNKNEQRTSQLDIFLDDGGLNLVVGIWRDGDDVCFHFPLLLLDERR